MLHLIPLICSDKTEDVMSKLHIGSDLELRTAGSEEFSLDEFESTELDKQARVRQRIEALAEQRALKKQLSDEWDN